MSRELRAKLLRYKLTFDFVIESLYPLSSTPGQQDLTLKSSISESFVRAFFSPLGRSLNEALQLPDDVRLLLVDELLRVLTDFRRENPPAGVTTFHNKTTFDFTSLLKSPTVSFGSMKH